MIDGNEIGFSMALRGQEVPKVVRLGEADGRDSRGHRQARQVGQASRWHPDQTVQCRQDVRQFA